MELQLLNEKVKKNEECLEKLTLAMQTDHEETCKQSYQIDQLYKKLGNGWSGKITKSLEILQERINNEEKDNIQINNKLDVLTTQVKELKESPQNNRAKAKDFLYIAMGIISVGTVVLNIIGVV